MSPIELAEWIQDVYNLLCQVEETFEAPWVGKMKNKERRMQFEFLRRRARALLQGPNQEEDDDE